MEIITGKRVLTGNQTIAIAVALVKPDVIVAYPITPQTIIVEELSEYYADFENVKFINVESEHSMLASCIAASRAGARVFTATSSQGLLLAHEELHRASRSRTPVVMVNVNRGLMEPWILQPDHTDSLSQRDTGWIQFYCENNQEALDLTIRSFRIAESVLLPAIINIEGFVLSHTAELVDVPSQELVNKYLPPFNPPFKIDVNDPHAFGACPSPEEYQKMHRLTQEGMENTKKTVKEADQEFQNVFGRSYGVIEKYHWENPEIVLVTMGAITGTARIAVEKMRNVALLKIGMFRPFPWQEIQEALAQARKVAVIDKNISLGSGGILAQEIKAVLYDLKRRPRIYGFIGGLGGVDITPNTIEWVIKYARKHSPEEILWIPERVR